MKITPRFLYAALLSIGALSLSAPSEASPSWWDKVTGTVKGKTKGYISSGTAAVKQKGQEYASQGADKLNTMVQSKVGSKPAEEQPVEDEPVEDEHGEEQPE